MKLTLILTLLALASPALAADPINPNPQKRNILIFVADGLRHDSVNAADTPAMLSLREKGVHFSNSHSLFPTYTMVNASAIATGHAPGDTGVLSNTLFTGNGASPLAGLESDPNLRALNDSFANKNIVNEITLLAAAREAGFHTAAVGKYGPATMQDVSQNAPGVTPTTILIDDATFSTSGVALPKPISDAIDKLNIDARPPGTSVPNVRQQAWFLKATLEVVLPSFVNDAKNDKPFVVVYWSRDPDKSQHDETDNRNPKTREFDQLGVGINGPSVHAGIKNADSNLAALLKYLNDTDDPHHPGQKLAANTDIFVTSDHGFSTISKHELPNGKFVDDFCSTIRFFEAGTDAPEQDTPDHFLPEGFLPIDIANGLKLPLFDAGTVQRRTQPAAGQSGLIQFMPVDPTKLPVLDERQQHTTGGGLIGGNGQASYTTANNRRTGTLDPAAKLLVVGPLIFFPNLKLSDSKAPAPKASPEDIALATQTVNFLTSQSTISAVFVDTSLFGKIPGALAFTDINLTGSGQTPRPGIVVSYTNFSLDPKNPLLSGVSLADSALQESQGMHGSFGRQDTFNNMIAFGPDFQNLNDTDPVSNADLAPTLAYILGLKTGGNGTLAGRVLDEALKNGPALHTATPSTVKSDPTPGGFQTVLQLQTLKDANGQEFKYFDYAGMPGRVVTGQVSP